MSRIMKYNLKQVNLHDFLNISNKIVFHISNIKLELSELCIYLILILSALQILRV